MGASGRVRDGTEIVLVARGQEAGDIDVEQKLRLSFAEGKLFPFVIDDKPIAKFNAKKASLEAGSANSIRRHLGQKPGVPGLRRQKLRPLFRTAARETIAAHPEGAGRPLRPGTETQVA